MDQDEARRLLDRIGVLRQPCDLDLLIFFARHPRSLLTSESLARFLGYGLKQIADSLEVLLAAGLITRVQVPTHAARLYVFAIDDKDGGDGNGTWVHRLLEVASTRGGRLALRGALIRQRETTNRGQLRSISTCVTPGPRALAADRDRGPRRRGRRP